MFTKIVVMIVLGISLSLSSGGTPTNTASLAAPEAMVSLYLGPMVIDFARADGSPVNLSFEAAADGIAKMNVFHIHVSPSMNPLKTYLSTRESSQKPAHRLPTLP